MYYKGSIHLRRDRHIRITDWFQTSKIWCYWLWYT